MLPTTKNNGTNKAAREIAYKAAPRTSIEEYAAGITESMNTLPPVSFISMKDKNNAITANEAQPR